ncbi:MAG: hypothetical protein DSZ10_06085 [Sulfurovum sp.]|nr:MAG: hypothetical protein DSZ10_06085 [Sulfurovum sp.]
MNIFLKKMMEWALEKEEAAAKNCHASAEEISEQIRKVLLKKKEIEGQCKEQTKEMEHILDKLHWIKAEAIKCERELEEEIDKK